jgi:hypothetical protein
MSYNLKLKKDKYDIEKDQLATDMAPHKVAVC